MMRGIFPPIFAVVALLALAASVAPAAAVLRGVKPTSPILARLWLADRKDRDVALVGVAEDRVAIADPASPVAAPDVLEKSVVQRAQFELTLDQDALAQAERERDWVSVYRLLFATLSPAFPYLDLPDNNAVEHVWKLGTVMTRMAERTERSAVEAGERERAVRQFEAAYDVFQHLAGVGWSPLGELARLQGVQCLLKRNLPGQARTVIEGLREPLPGDSAYGSYWLTRGLLAIHGGDTNAAMEAAILSLAFENKDIGTFPEALLLSARCYEAIREWHRARDVYFEVATLLPGTDWADDAAARLEKILGSNRTVDQEPTSVESAFFGYQEDLNELSRALLKARAAADADGGSSAVRRPANPP